MRGISRIVENHGRRLPYTSSGRCDRQWSQAADVERGDLGAAFEGAIMRRSAEGDENLFSGLPHWK